MPWYSFVHQHWVAFVVALLACWLYYEYTNLFILHPWFQYRPSLMQQKQSTTVDDDHKDDDDTYCLFFQITLPCLTWEENNIIDDDVDEEQQHEEQAQSREALDSPSSSSSSSSPLPTTITPSEECERQSDRLHHAFYHEESFLAYSTRAARLYGAPDRINLLWAELHTWRNLEHGDERIDATTNGDDDDSQRQSNRQLGSLAGPIVAVANREDAKKLVEKLQQYLAKGGENSTAERSPQRIGLHATWMDSSSNRPLLHTRIHYNRGWLTLYKAAIYLVWATTAPPRIADLARTHRHVVDRNNFATVFLEQVSHNGNDVSTSDHDQETLQENIRYIDLWVFLQGINVDTS